MPTATDLVTDLPADFETFGQAVATSMADLLGGTTGQVLSKASNTDMDFTWVAQDDSNAIQNAIVDAKGDLIAASAADTPARLAVGGNNLVLTADSSTATGLKYSADWTAYTPTFTNLTVGNGTVAARYLQVGKHVLVYFKFVMGSTSVMGTNPYFTLPVTAENVVQAIMGNFYIQDSGVAEYTGTILWRSNTLVDLRILGVNGTYLGGPNQFSATLPFTWGTNDYFEGIFSYGAA